MQYSLVINYHYLENTKRTIFFCIVIGDKTITLQNISLYRKV